MGVKNDILDAGHLPFADLQFLLPIEITLFGDFYFITAGQEIFNIGRAEEKTGFFFQAAVDKQLGLLLSNPQHPSLNIKKMNDPRNIWEGRVTVSYRFTLQVQDDIYILRKVGTHDMLKNP